MTRECSRNRVKAHHLHLNRYDYKNEYALTMPKMLPYVGTSPTIVAYDLILAQRASGDRYGSGVERAVRHDRSVDVRGQKT